MLKQCLENIGEGLLHACISSTSVIRSRLECGAQIWHGSLNNEQSRDIERIQKRALKMICPEKTSLSYEQALIQCDITTLKSRREATACMCINLVKDTRKILPINSTVCYQAQLAK
jgi:hypothetical protein